MRTGLRTSMARLIGPIALSAALLLAAPAAGSAQQQAGDQAPWPFSNVVFSGYGVVGYDADLGDTFRHDFDATFAPILLFDLGSDFLFETELKLAPHGDGVDLELEYAQGSYLGFERLTLTGGIFLLPFGVFGERLHAAWINRMPSMPLVYQHAHGGVATNALLPILSDLGAMARYALPMSSGWRLDFAGWVSQGPRVLADEDLHSDDPAHSLRPMDAQRVAARAAVPASPLFNGVPNGSAGDSPFDIPTVGYGISFSTDGEQRNRMLGSRIGLLRPPNLEIYLSAFHAKYNPGDYLDLVGANLAAEWRRGSWEVRGEAAAVWQEFVHENTYVHLRSPAYYVQAARRFGAIEPVVRWSELLDATVEGETARPGRRQLAVGLNYWLRPAVPMKAAYEVNRGGDDRLLLQWALGF
jgi:hypothetical protein